MEGKVFDESMIQGLFGLLEKDFPLDAHAPGGMITYRRTLVLSFFYKYYLTIRKQLGLAIPEKSETLLAEHHRPISTGTQDYVQAKDTAPVGVDTPHQSGLKQVTGEAVYVDDIPVHHNELFAAMVHSEKAHALIKSVDASAALQHHGVVAFFGANDVPYNQIGPVIKDEEMFASKEVLCVGYPIGIVVAKTQREAQQAARLVKVEYEDLDAVLTIQEAIEKNAFFAEKHHITRGDVDKAFESCDHIVEGKFEMVRYLQTISNLFPS
jgi:xanthine dehydrogenase/oxidase